MGEAAASPVCYEPTMIEIVGIDADDTLWDEASLFEAGEARFVAKVEEWTSRSDIRACLRELHFALITEVGYGPVGYRKALRKFADERLEAHLRTRAHMLADDVCDWIEGSRITPLEGVPDALERLSNAFKVVLITKGDQAWQTTKLEHSGLSSRFDAVHIVSEKDRRLYAGIFGMPKSKPHAAMLGNSVKSDILPAMAAGALGLHVPFHRTSPLEEVEWSGEHELYRQFPSFELATQWLLDTEV